MGQSSATPPTAHSCLTRWNGDSQWRIGRALDDDVPADLYFSYKDATVKGPLEVCQKSVSSGIFRTAARIAVQTLGRNGQLGRDEFVRAGCSAEGSDSKSPVPTLCSLNRKRAARFDDARLPEIFADRPLHVASDVDCTLELAGQWTGGSTRIVRNSACPSIEVECMQ